MSYGQSIPAKVVWDKTVRRVTRAAYCHAMAKALVAAGMKFLPCVSEYDFLDAKNEEGEHDAGGQYAMNAFFDFPTSETFTVNAIQYRPLLGMRYSGETHNPNVVNGLGMEAVVFELLVRRADRLDGADFRSYIYFRYSSNYFGMGGSTEAWPAALDGAAFFDASWLASNRLEWASWPTLYAHRPRTIGNIFVYLGPGGLTICTGSDPGVSGFSSVHACAFVFYGSRIPGRARNPLNDPNFTRINPVVSLPFRTTDTEFLTTPGDYHRAGFVLGCQYDLQIPPQNVDPIYFYQYNLENVDKAAFSDLYTTVRRSPRVVNGFGRHILAPMVGFPNARRALSTEFYSAVNLDISTTRASPPWEDFFYAPNMRFTDGTAPIGNYEDPVTLTNWWLVPMTNTDARLAMNVEGAVTLADIPASFPAVLQTTEQYDGSASGDASAFPRTTTFVRNTTGPSGVPNFPWVSGQNILRAQYTNHSAGGHFRRTRIRILMTPYTFDPEYQFSLKYELTVRTTQVTVPTATTDAPHFYVWVNTPYGTVRNPGLYVIAGRSAGENGYNSRTMEHVLTPAYGNGDPSDVLQGAINLGLHAYDATSINFVGTCTIEVSNLRIEISKH